MNADSALRELVEQWKAKRDRLRAILFRTAEICAVDETISHCIDELESILAAPQAAPAGMVLVPRQHNDDEDCNCEQVGYAIGWNAARAAAPAAGMNPPVDQERDMLAKAIRDAAVKAGIARADASMTGPMLLMLCDDLANAAAPSQGPGFIVVKEHVWHPVPGDRPELAYLWPAAFGQMVFQDAEAAHTFIQQPPGLPLGWVVLRLGNGAFAKPEAAPAAQVAEPVRLAPMCHAVIRDEDVVAAYYHASQGKEAEQFAKARGWECESLFAGSAIDSIVDQRVKAAAQVAERYEVRSQSIQDGWTEWRACSKALFDRLSDDHPAVVSGRTQIRKVEAAAPAVVVDEAMVRRAIDAQPYAKSDNDAARVWELFREPDAAFEIMEFAINAALGQGKANG